MDYRVVLISAGLAAVLMGCQAEVGSPSRDRTYTISAGFEENATRVSLDPAPSSLDLLAKWQQEDEVKVLLYGPKSYLELPAVPVFGISEDGKDCVFTFSIPDDYEIPESGYRLICYTIPPESDDLDKPRELKEAAALDLPLLRYPIEQFRTPVMFDGQVMENNAIIAFHHLYTYEVLHMKNATNAPVSFSLTGFYARYLWYRTTHTMEIEGFGTGGGGGGGGGEAWPSRYHAKQVVDPVRESPVTTIEPYSEAIIISAYVPNGIKISEAQMYAAIDGTVVMSANTLSSDVELQTGHAYHMYAMWDGIELRFIPTSIGEPGSSELDAGGTGYGTDGTGNVSGSGLGYGTDASGNITGSGSGYGADGSGPLSGEGAGYSTGN